MTHYSYKFQPKMEKPKRKAVLPSTEEDDAASYASSTSTLDVQDSSLEAVGISPLNRKKLNSESSDQMESTDPFNPPIFMSSKSTVIMKSSVPERWSNWRRSKSSFVKKESEAPKVKRKQTVDMPLVTKSSSRVQEWREVGSFASQESQHDGQFRLDGTMTMTNDELDDNVAKQILLRKQSTTFALRHQLQGIDMVDATANIGHSGPLTRLKRKRSLEIADVSYDGDMMSAPLMKKQSTTFGIRQKLSGTKLSREPTLLLAPVKEERKRRLSTVKEEIISLDEPDSVTSPIAKKQKRVFSSSQVSSDIQNIKDEEQITNSSSTKKKRTRSVAFSSQDTMTPKPKKIRKSGSTLAAAAKVSLITTLCYVRESSRADLLKMCS